jgi:tetratricopeptide (TPR) repeat protein
MIGIFVAVVWEIAARVRASSGARRIAALAATISLAALAVVAVRQVNVWRDGQTLFTYTLSVTRRNWFAANNFGTFLIKKRDLTGALAQFEQSARWKPDYEEAWYNQGFVLNDLHRYPEAVAAFQTNLRLAPGNIDGWNNFGYALVALRRYPDALRAFETALSQKPDDAMALHGAGAMRASLGDRTGALQYLARLEHVDRSRASQLRRDLGVGQ